MKKIIILGAMEVILAICFFAFFPWTVAVAETNVEQAPAYVPGELLVKFTPAVRIAASADYRARMGVSSLKTYEITGAQHIKLPEGMTVEEALEIYRNDPDVEYAEPNYYRYATATPNDPSFGLLWGLHNTGQNVNGASGTSDADIDAPEAWETETGDSAVIVAVLDTGADWDHEDLSANIWSNDDEPENGADTDGNGKVDDVRGWDFVNDDNDPDDDNSSGGSYHGTHVSGIIGAEGDNAKGIVGVNWAVSIMPLKILDNAGSGTVADEVEAINYAIANGAKIINASFSGSSYSVLEYDAIKSAGDAGILFVAAAGNHGDDDVGPGWDNDAAGQAVYPASHDLANIIAVAATNQVDVRASFSNYGGVSVDVAAPGVNIYSTKAGNAYQYMSGTSMATPHVAGLAALIWAEDVVGYEYSDVKPRILNGVDVLSGLTGKVLMAGRINANTCINPPGNSPDAPTGFSVSVLSSSQIGLSWTDVADDESGFKVERKTGSGGTYAHIATIEENAEAYTDTALTDGTTYYYRACAFSGAGNSSYSNEDNEATYIIAPTGLSASGVSSSRIELSWSDNSAAESGYSVEQKAGSGGVYSEIGTVDAGVTTYDDTALSASSTYYYRVKAYNSTGNSDYSNVKSATTLAVSAGSSGGSSGGGCFVSSLI